MRTGLKKRERLVPASQLRELVMATAIESSCPGSEFVLTANKSNNFYFLKKIEFSALA